MTRTLSAVAFAFFTALLTALPLSLATANPIVEVAFVLDTTGSMGPLIEGAKRKIWSIATSILDCSPNAEIRMGLVAYRDIGDDYVTKVYPLTTDIQDLYGNLLSLRARGGGDWPESVNEALDVAVHQLSWTAGPGVTRIMFLVGDAPPHMDYPQDRKFPEVLANARAQGITVNAVQAGEARDTQRIWREIAQRGNGEYIPIPQDGGHLVVIETPYDLEIIELQKTINRTVVPFGSRNEQQRTERKVAQVAAAPPSAGADMAGYLNKRAASSEVAEAVTGRGDLVAEVASGRQKLDALKDEELPDALRKLKAAERKDYLEKQLAERNTLNGKLTGLLKQRDAYVSAQQKKAPAKTGDSFDRAVESTLQKQIRK